MGVDIWFFGSLPNSSSGYQGATFNFGAPKSLIGLVALKMLIEVI